MDRRSLLKRGLILPLAVPAVALARPSSDNIPLPYSEVGPILTDARKCLHVFQFSCGHCRRFHGPLVAWGRTLPKAYQFVSVPLVLPDRDHVTAARAWYAVSNIAPTHLDAFAEAAFQAIIDRGMPMSSAKTWAQSVERAGVPSAEFVKAWGKVDERRLSESLDLLSKYRIQSTPSLAIGGRYVITPDNTQGDMELFIKLASGLVSKTLW